MSSATNTAIQRVAEPAGQLGPAMSFTDMEKMAKYVASSGLFACKRPEEAMTLMMLCQAEGLHLIDAMRTYHLIQGRPTMRSDAMQARFQQRGGKVEWVERTDKAVEAKFSHPDGGTVNVRWTMEMAQKANLANKDTWKSYPRQMLTARVVSEGVRTVLPGVVAGIYTPEEQQDIVDDRGPRTRTPSREVEPQAAAGAAAVEGEVIDPHAGFRDAWDKIADETWGIDVDVARRFVVPMAKKLKVELVDVEGRGLPSSDEGRRKLLKAFADASPGQINTMTKLVEGTKPATDIAPAEEAPAEAETAAAGA